MYCTVHVVHGVDILCEITMYIYSTGIYYSLSVFIIEHCPDPLKVLVRDMVARV